MLNPSQHPLAGMLCGSSQTALRRKSWPPGREPPDAEHCNSACIEFFTTHIVLRPSVLAYGGVHLEISRSYSDPEPVATFDRSSSDERSLAFGAIRLGRPDFHSNATQQQI